MCACRPNVRTPNCGSLACTAAAHRQGELEGLKNALAILGDLSARTVGKGLMADAFREAYSVVEGALVERIAVAEASVEKGREPCR